MSNPYFQFEQDFVESLRCIPMIVRLKLDTCGVKLKLNHWYQLNSEEKENLVNLPCSSPIEAEEYRQKLQDLLIAKTGNPAGELVITSHPDWLETELIPESVLNKATEFDLHLTLAHWQKLTPLQRFALIKLSRSNHENANFYPALQEFGLIDN